MSEKFIENNPCIFTRNCYNSKRWEKQHTNKPKEQNMKVRVSEREVRKQMSTIVKVGYQGAHYLTIFENCHFYTSGLTGWNSDIYTIWGMALSTGYRPFGNVEAINLQRWENKAKGVYESKKISYSQKEKRIHNLFKEFMKSHIGKDLE